jgi:hypothetical protein
MARLVPAPTDMRMANSRVPVRNLAAAVAIVTPLIFFME